MRSPEIGNLSGVTLLHSPDTLDYGPAIAEFEPGSATRKRISIFQEAERHTMELARELGATILEVDENSGPHPADPPVYWQNRTYFAAYAATEKIIAANQEHIPCMPRYSFTSPNETFEVARTQLHEGHPLMLVYKPQDRGHMKYLITGTDQLERFYNFTNLAGNRIDISNFELREFVKTPSDHYTSFRLVVDATGTLLAAALDYSIHTKDRPLPVMKRDRFSDSRPNSSVRYIKHALEDPDSPYFLGAHDVRSNSPNGTHIIALMGTNRKPANREAQSILEAHDIDPAHPEPPQKLVDVAQFIGRIVGPSVHLLLGVDFFGPYYGETNFGPGGVAYGACHMGGGGTVLERYIAMRENALANIARMHNR